MIDPTTFNFNTIDLPLKESNQNLLRHNNTNNGKTFTIITICILVGTAIYLSNRFLPTVNKKEKQEK
jgi:hypothetical protein